MEPAKKKRRNIKKIGDGTAYSMLKNMAMFASERQGLGLRKKKIGTKKDRSRSAIRKKKSKKATTGRGKCKL